MHISKIIDYVKNEIRFSQEFCEDNVFVTLRIEPISKIIENLEQSHKDILELTKEIEQKDKIIYEVAKSNVKLKGYEVEEKYIDTTIRFFTKYVKNLERNPQWRNDKNE